MIHEERLKILKGGSPEKGNYILYWMQASQRAEYNHALEFAVREANKHKLPLLVCFVITDNYPDANARHYHFMLEGIKQTAAILNQRNINLTVRKGAPALTIAELSKKAAVTIFDCGYMPIQKQWRKQTAMLIKTPIIQVESDSIVPVESASPKEEYAAYTFRPKITKQLDHFLQPLESQELKVKTKLDMDSIDISNPAKLTEALNINKSISTSEKYNPGGSLEAQKRLKIFINKKLVNYSKFRNNPDMDFQSGLSPYIHFGQISTLQIAIEVKKSGINDTEDFLDELIVRRELAINFAYYNDSCQEYSSLPPWAQATLKEHAKDRREYIYSLNDLENAMTHDPYWNAAQKEMLISGKMHGYMRMYWGKMIMQWSKTPQEAFKNISFLNNKYELDGRDPSSCAGIAWCFGKHDRPWPNNPVLGKVRVMKPSGLKRKFDMQKYINKISSIIF